MAQRIQSRNWVFTINNPETNDIPKGFNDVKYCIWQREKGAEGTEHLQGYVAFSKVMSLSACKKLDKTAHWEKRQGTEQQCIDYCSKEDTRIAGPWELGEKPQPGKRNDLLEVCEKIKAGVSMIQIAEQHPVQIVKYSRGFTTLARLLAKPRTEMPEVIVVVGPSDSGKSHFCREESPDAYFKPSADRWFDDYDGVSDIIIDEFYGWLPYCFILRLCDKYPMKVETKGGFVNVNCKRIYFTSNQKPENWYRNMNYAPLKRRISKIYEFVSRTEHYVYEEDGTKVLLL